MASRKYSWQLVCILDQCLAVDERSVTVHVWTIVVLLAKLGTLREEGDLGRACRMWIVRSLLVTTILQLIVRQEAP